MVLHSKARPRLADVTRGLSCDALYHPWTSSCRAASCDMVLSSLVGSSKFFAPIYLAQLLLNWRKVNLSYLKKEARAYIKSVMFSTCMGSTFVPVGCILSFISSCTILCLSHCDLGGFDWTGRCRPISRRLIGYHEYASVFLPGLVGGFAIFVEQPHKRGIIMPSFAAMVLEYVLNQLDDCGMFRLSRKLAALLFMASNGLLMYLLRSEYLFPRANISKNIWFFHPPPVKREATGKLERLCDTEEDAKSPSSICPHRGSCLNHILMEVSKYTLIGVGLQLVRKGIPQLRGVCSVPSLLVRLLCDRHSMKLGVFLGAYVGIFAVASCTLNLVTGRDTELQSMVAGALAGLAYWFQPNLTFALTAFTTALVMLSRHLMKQEIISCIPELAGVLFAISFGILLHARAFEAQLCPRLVTSITNTTTNGRCGLIADLFKLRQEAFIKSLKLVT